MSFSNARFDLATLHRCVALAVLGTGMVLPIGCTAPLSEEPKTVQSGDGVIARRPKHFGLFGAQTSYYLYAYQPESLRKTSKRCWYANEVGENDPRYQDVRGAAFNFRAMSNAATLVSYPLDDRFVREHLLFWSGANVAFAAMDMASGPATCTEAVVGLTVSAVLPVMLLPTAGAMVACGMSMWGITQAADAAAGASAAVRAGDLSNLERSGTSREDYGILKQLREAVEAKQGKQDKAAGECPSPDVLMRRYRTLFAKQE
jgi:hypothetical protein